MKPLQSCSTLVTVLFYSCYTLVIVLLHSCYSLVTVFEFSWGRILQNDGRYQSVVIKLPNQIHSWLGEYASHNHHGEAIKEGGIVVALLLNLNPISTLVIQPFDKRLSFSISTSLSIVLLTIMTSLMIIKKRSAS